MTFDALIATKTHKTISTRLIDFNEHDLVPGNVTFAVEYSTVNYQGARSSAWRGRGRSSSLRGALPSTLLLPQQPTRRCCRIGRAETLRLAHRRSAGSCAP